jgi:hypothetical protein
VLGLPRIKGTVEMKTQDCAPSNPGIHLGCAVPPAGQGVAPKKKCKKHKKKHRSAESAKKKHCKKKKKK